MEAIILFVIEQFRHFAGLFSRDNTLSLGCYGINMF